MLEMGWADSVMVMTTEQIDARWIEWVLRRLRREGISVEPNVLASVSARDLLRHKHIGRKCVKFVRRWLNGQGLDLRPDAS